jgi:iron(III) transport system ATP-binding protein
VFENVAFPLRERKLPKKVIQEKVEQMLSMVMLSGFADRRVNSLSGGQQQRVAIARALVNEPKVLLLDEPLGALDLKLRKDMQQELKKIQKEMGITFVFVTHDQEEALTLSDHICVFKRGVVDQIGTPNEIYNKSKTEYTNNFIGDVNKLTPELVSMINASPAGKGVLDPQKNNYVRLEKVHIGRTGADFFTAEATVQDIEYYGMYIKYHLSVGGHSTLKVFEKNDGVEVYSLGEKVTVSIRPRDILGFVPEPDETATKPAGKNSGKKLFKKH